MKRLILLTLILLMVGIGCGNVYSQRSTYGKAPDFKLKSIDGDTVKLSDYSGKVIILNFFATWCPPCRMEMPGFNEIAKVYKNKVKIIAINLGENLSRVKDFAKSYNLEFSILLDDGKVSRQYGPIRAIPVTFIIDKDFNIAKQYIGARTKDVFVKDIEGSLDIKAKAD